MRRAPRGRPAPPARRVRQGQQARRAAAGAVGGPVDNLGNHTATTTLNLNGQAITNIGDAYNSGWYRSNTAGVGLYNQQTGRHLYSESSSYWTVASGNGMIFRNSHAGTITGYVYSDGGSSFGLLSPSGNWRVRVDNSNTELYGAVYSGVQYTEVVYDRNNTGYYLDMNNGSNFNVTTANESYVNGWFRVNTAGGIYWQAYGGGWNMQDSTWLRTYGDKPILASGGIAGYGNSVFGTQYGGNPRMYASYDNATGGGIAVSDDGGFYDFNDAWVEFRGSTGLAIRSDNTSWDMLFRMTNTAGSGPFDKRAAPDTNAWGLLGASGNAWWQVWGYSFNNASDERVKKDIEELSESDMRAMLDRLDRVRSVKFRYVEETSEPNEEHPEKYREFPHVGVIAQSMPDEVIVDKDGPVMGVSLADELGYTIAAVRGLRAEARERDTQLADRVEKLEMRIRELEETCK